MNNYSIYKNKTFWHAFPIYLEYSEVHFQHPCLYGAQSYDIMLYTLPLSWQS